MYIENCLAFLLLSSFAKTLKNIIYDCIPIVYILRRGKYNRY